MTTGVHKAQSSGARLAASQFHPSVLQRLSYTIMWRKQENKHYMYYVCSGRRNVPTTCHIWQLRFRKCKMGVLFWTIFSKNETHVLQLIPYLQEPSREVLAIIHSLEVSNELLAGHLFPNILKGVPEKHNIIFLLLSQMTGMSNIRLNASLLQAQGRQH